MRHGTRVKQIVLIVLLALVCIGGVELAVCRFADPALYARITAPARRAASTAWGFLRDGSIVVWNGVCDGAAAAWDGAASFLSRTAGALQKNEAAPLEEQMALEPDQAYFIPPAATALTALQDRPEGAFLTGGSQDVIYYNQSDPEWADQPYGNDTLAGYGCGPTALAMAVSTLTDADMTPTEMAGWAVDNGYWARHGGSYLSIVNGAAEDFGLTVESVPDCTAADLETRLATGQLAVALMTQGHFTRSGHFILLRGITLEGTVLVSDPNSLDRSLAAWEPQLILDELSTSRNNGAPLWFLSPPA